VGEGRENVDSADSFDKEGQESVREYGEISPPFVE